MRSDKLSRMACACRARRSTWSRRNWMAGRSSFRPRSRCSPTTPSTRYRLVSCRRAPDLPRSDSTSARRGWSIEGRRFVVARRAAARHGPSGGQFNRMARTVPTPRLTNTSLLAVTLAGDDRRFLGGDRTDERQHDLAAMGVAGGTRVPSAAAWSTGVDRAKQDGHRRGIAHQIGDLDLAFGPKPDPGEIDRLALDPRACARQQDLTPFFTRACRDRRRGCRGCRTRPAAPTTASVPGRRDDVYDPGVT